MLQRIGSRQVLRSCRAANLPGGRIVLKPRRYPSRLPGARHLFDSTLQTLRPLCLSRQRLSPLHAAATEDEEIYVEDEDGNPIRWEDLTVAEQLNTQFGVEDVIEFTEGINGLPRVWIRHPNGQAIEVYLQGACITQWVKPDGKDLLFMRPDSQFRPDAPINCGVQVVFPQFKEGLLPSNGFAQSMKWEVVDSGWGASSMMSESWGVQDPAPYIVLRLRDTEETRKIWPYKFDVMYKIEVMETDDFPDFTVDKRFVSDDEDEQDNDVQQIMGVPQSVDDEEEGEESESEEEETVVEEPEQETKTSWRDRQKAQTYQQRLEAEAPPEVDDSIFSTQREPYSTTGGHYSYEDEEDEETQQRAKTGPKKKTTTKVVKSTKPGKPGRKKKRVADSDEDQEEVVEKTRAEKRKAARKAAGYDEDEDEDEAEDWRKVPLQLRMEFSVMNAEDEDGNEIDFNLGLLPMLQVKDLSTNEKFVRILGLGGVMGIDYYDSRVPRLFHNQEDFLHFRGSKVDQLFTDAADADVLFCPGNFTHLHLQLREGFKDVHVFHPGDKIIQDGPVNHTRFWTCLGGGHYLNTVKLQPREQWSGKMVLRYHHKYWEDPVFPQWRENSAPPLPRFPSTKTSKDDGLKIQGKSSNEILDEGGNYYDGPEDDLEVAPSYTDEQD